MSNLGVIIGVLPTFILLRRVTILDCVGVSATLLLNQIFDRIVFLAVKLYKHASLKWLKLSVYNLTVHEQYIQCRLIDYYFQRKCSSWNRGRKSTLKTNLLICLNRSMNWTTK